MQTPNNQTPNKSLFYTLTDGKITLRVRLSPNASQNTLNGLYHDASGQTWLKASVTTIPEKGKANKALINLLSKTLKTPKSSLEIISGETDRHKTIGIANPSDALIKRLDELA